MKLYTSNLIIFLFCAICLLTACSNEDKPSSFEPQLLTLPATDIMRNSATLHGAISLEGNTAAEHAHESHCQNAYCCTKISFHLIVFIYA